jgi:hypothetical protein
MKLNIELEDQKFKFEYSLGDGVRGACTMPLTLFSLRLFVGLCEYALNERDRNNETKMREIGLKALIETDTDLVLGWIDKYKRKKGDER